MILCYKDLLFIDTTYISSDVHPKINLYINMASKEILDLRQCNQEISHVLEVIFLIIFVNFYFLFHFPLYIGHHRGHHKKGHHHGHHHLHQKDHHHKGKETNDDDEGQGQKTSADLDKKLAGCKEKNSANVKDICDNLEQCQECLEGQSEPIEGQGHGLSDFDAHYAPFFRGRGAFLRGMFRGRGHWGQGPWFQGQGHSQRTNESSGDNLDLEKDIKMEDSQSSTEGQGHSEKSQGQKESQADSSQDPNYFFPPNFGRFMHGRGHFMRGMTGRGMFQPHTGSEFLAGRGSEFWKSPRGMMLRGMMGRLHHRGGPGRGHHWARMMAGCGPWKRPMGQDGKFHCPLCGESNKRRTSRENRP